MNNQNDSIETLEQIAPTKISLIPSGFHSPALNLSFRQRFYQTNYEREIIRSYLSSGISRISLQNQIRYIVSYQSEFQLIEVKEDGLSSFTITEFAAFIIPLKHRKNPKIIKCYMLDRQNVLQQLEIDLIDEKEPVFFKCEPEVNPISEKIANVIIKQWVLSEDERQLILVSDHKLYIIDLLEEASISIKNPLRFFPLEKPLIQISKSKECIILAQQQQLFIYNKSNANNKWKQLHLNQQIKSISLCQEVLFIITSTNIIKLNNIFNNFINICFQDYVSLQIKIKYAQIDAEYSQFGVLVSEENEVNLLNLNNLDKQINLDPIGQLLECKSIQLIEIEKQQQPSSMTIRIFYFTDDDHLKVNKFQRNI